MTNVKKIANILNELGYRAKIDGNSIESGISGCSVLLLIFDDSIQIYCGFNLKKESKFGLQEANDFNKRYRFSRCYVNDEKTSVSFEQDFYFSVNQDKAKEVLEQIMDCWGIIINLAREALYSVQLDLT